VKVTGVNFFETQCIYVPELTAHYYIDHEYFITVSSVYTVSKTHQL